MDVSLNDEQTKSKHDEDMQEEDENEQDAMNAENLFVSQEEVKSDNTLDAERLVVDEQTIYRLLTINHFEEYEPRHVLESASLQTICQIFLNLLKNDVKPLIDFQEADLKLCTQYVELRVKNELYALLMEEFDLIIPEWKCSLPNKLLRITEPFIPFHILLSVLKERSQQLTKLRDYPPNTWCFMKECVVCFETVCCVKRNCCAEIICDGCLTEYFKMRVSEGLIRISCPNISCESVIPPMEITSHLPEEYRVKYIQFLVDANSDPCCRTCPQCCEITQVTQESLNTASKKKGLSVQCVQCGLLWCFSCHAPQHSPLTCKQFQKGQIPLKKWAKMRRSEDLAPQAQKCPKCAFYIERTEGCDHMTCSRCKTEFCYKCGERFVKIKFIGKHSHKFSIFGCPQILMPNKPHVRRFLRGTIFASILMLSGPAVALAVPLAVAVAVVGLPSLGIYKAVNAVKRSRRNRFCYDVTQVVNMDFADALNIYGQPAVSESAFDWEEESVFFGDLFTSNSSREENNNFNSTN